MGLHKFIITHLEWWSCNLAHLKYNNNYNFNYYLKSSTSHHMIKIWSTLQVHNQDIEANFFFTIEGLERHEYE